MVKISFDGDGGEKLLVRQWSVPEEKIRIWVSHYRLHDIDGLLPKRCKSKLPIEHWHEWIGDASVADAMFDGIMLNHHRPACPGPWHPMPAI